MYLKDNFEPNCIALNPVVCHMYIAVDSVEVKIEADDNDISESPHGVMPTTGMFAVSNAWYILFSVTFEE